jgi:hypothetical protein
LYAARSQHKNQRRETKGYDMEVCGFQHILKQVLPNEIKLGPR